MLRRPPKSTRTATLFPYTTLFRSIVSSDDGDKRLIVSMASPEQIGSYYLYDVESGKFALIGHASEALADGKLNPVKTIRYKASDGLEIEAILTTPRLRAGQKELPVVCLTPGTLEGRRVGKGWVSTGSTRVWP